MPELNIDLVSLVKMLSKVCPHASKISRFWKFSWKHSAFLLLYRILNWLTDIIKRRKIWDAFFLKWKIYLNNPFNQYAWLSSIVKWNHNFLLARVTLFEESVTTQSQPRGIFTYLFFFFLNLLFDVIVVLPDIDAWYFLGKHNNAMAGFLLFYVVGLIKQITK